MVQELLLLNGHEELAWIIEYNRIQLRLKTKALVFDLTACRPDLKAATGLVLTWQQQAGSLALRNLWGLSPSVTELGKPLNGRRSYAFS